MTSSEPDGDPREAQTTDSLELVQRAQDGDLSAHNQLFGRYYERVRRIVRLRLGAGLRSHLESGDILQETFVAAVQAFENFEVRNEASLINWLAKIAEHRIRAAAERMGAEKRDRRREVALEHVRSSLDRGELVCDPVDELPLPDEIAAEAELVGLIEDALAALSDDHREVILLRNYTGASYQTIAELMQRPSPDAARMLHRRAVIELAAHVRT